MSDERKAKQDAFYADEPWAKLATEAGFRPWDTESSARGAFRYCAESMVKRDLADALAAALRSAQQSIADMMGVQGYPLDSGAGEILREVNAALAAWEARK